MKKYLCLLLTALLLQFAANAQTPTATDVLKPIYAKAAQAHKQVLLIFHASWCGWCKKMDASLADTSIKAAIERNFEIAHLTVYENGSNKQFENPGALALLTKFGGADKGLPYWFVVDAKGNKLANSEYEPGKNVGCPSEETEVAYFIKVLQQTASFTKDELQKISKRFRQNKG